MPGGVAPKFGCQKKVSRYTGVSQLQLRVSRYTVQLSREDRVFKASITGSPIWRSRSASVMLVFGSCQACMAWKVAKSRTWEEKMEKPNGKQPLACDPICLVKSPKPPESPKYEKKKIPAKKRNPPPKVGPQKHAKNTEKYENSHLWAIFVFFRYFFRMGICIFFRNFFVFLGFRGFWALYQANGIVTPSWTGAKNGLPKMA